jgi:hypothetical protein
LDPTRRGFLKTAVTAAGAAAIPSGVAQANAHADAGSHGHDHDHAHQAVPSDPALRVKALESLLVEKGLVQRCSRLRSTR